MGSSTEADEATTAARVEEIVRIRIDGAEFHDIRGYADEDGRAWGLTDADLAALVDRADDLLVARLERKRGRVLARAVAQRQSVYARAVNAGDLGVALAALQDLAKLQGLYPQPPKVAELTKLVKAQDALIEELEARGPEIRSLEPSPPEGGTGQDEAETGQHGQGLSTGLRDGSAPGLGRQQTAGEIHDGP